MTAHPSLAFEKQLRKVKLTPQPQILQPQIIREQVDLTPLIERLDIMESNILKLGESLKLIQTTLNIRDEEDKEIMALLTAKLKKKS